MDKRALIQQYLNGRLNSAQIAEFTRQLKDPEFCNILSENVRLPKSDRRQAKQQPRWPKWPKPSPYPSRSKKHL